MAIPTIQEAINRGSVSIYLAGNNNAKGALFGKRLAAPGSMTTIAMITDALSWGYDGGAQTEQSLRQTANYLVWLCGSYGQQAQYILEGNGGGSVVPGGGGSTSSIYPLVIYSSYFTYNAGDGKWEYINSDISGTNIMLFINEWTQQWLFSPTAFTYITNGIQIQLDGFDPGTYDYTVVIEKFNN